MTRKLCIRGLLTSRSSKSGRGGQNELIESVDSVRERHTSHAKMAEKSTLILRAKEFLGAPPVDVAVVLLLAVEVEAALGWVVAVDVVETLGEEVEVVDDVEVEVAVVVGVGVGVVRPGPETDVSPCEGVAAPEVTAAPVAACPLHVAFPVESLPHVSPLAEVREGKRILHKWTLRVS